MRSSERPVIGFLTDFGLDGAAATCRGIMLGICRDAQIVDICHTVAKYAIRDGAYILRTALPYLPVGVHVGVVDPGVGTERRPLAIRCGRGDVLVGPDNGLLLPAADTLGGAQAARELTNADLWLAPASSATFHGRDIFAPVAAWLAAGAATYDDVGPAIEPGRLERLAEPAVSAAAGRLDTEVIYVDSFGNVRLAGGRQHLLSAFGDAMPGHTLQVEVADSPPHEAVLATTFGEVAEGESVLYLDSSGNLALAISQGDYAGRSGVVAGAPVRIEDRRTGTPRQAG